MAPGWISYAYPCIEYNKNNWDASVINIKEKYGIYFSMLPANNYYLFVIMIKLVYWIINMIFL